MTHAEEKASFLARLDAMLVQLHANRRPASTRANAAADELDEAAFHLTNALRYIDEGISLAAGSQLARQLCAMRDQLRSIAAEHYPEAYADGEQRELTCARCGDVVATSEPISLPFTCNRCLAASRIRLQGAGPASRVECADLQRLSRVELQRPEEPAATGVPRETRELRQLPSLGAALARARRRTGRGARPSVDRARPTLLKGHHWPGVDL